MAKNNYQRQKDQKDQAKRRKKAEKLQRRQEKGTSDTGEESTDVEIADNPEATAENPDGESSIEEN